MKPALRYILVGVAAIIGCEIVADFAEANGGLNHLQMIALLCAVALVAQAATWTWLERCGARSIAAATAAGDTRKRDDETRFLRLYRVVSAPLVVLLALVALLAAAGSRIGVN